MSAADGSDVSGGPVTTCHFDGKLTGLARHPQRAEYVTAGGDGTVSYRVSWGGWVWSTFVLVSHAELALLSRCV